MWHLLEEIQRNHKKPDSEWMVSQSRIELDTFQIQAWSVTGVDDYDDDNDDKSWVLRSCNYTFRKSVTYSSPLALLKHNTNKFFTDWPASFISLLDWHLAIVRQLFSLYNKILKYYQYRHKTLSFLTSCLIRWKKLHRDSIAHPVCYKI